MSQDSSKVSDKASEIAKNIWLAGLGAYGKAFDEAKDRIDEAFDEAKDRIDEASKEPPRLFKELVKKGEELEDEVRDSLSNIRRSHAQSVEERINRVKENLQFSIPGKSDQLAEINRKLDELSEQVDAISKALKITPARKPAAKKTTTRKKAPAKTPARKKKATATRKKSR